MIMVSLNENTKKIIAILGRDKDQVASVEVYYKNAEFEEIHSFYEPADLVQFIGRNQDELHVVAILKDQENIGWQPVCKAIRTQVSTPVVLFIDMNENLTENEQRFLSKLPDGSWLRSPLKYRSQFINASAKSIDIDAKINPLQDKLTEVKNLYKKHLITSAQKVHASILENYNASSCEPDYMEKVENGILEIENILNSELSGFNHNFEVMEFYIESDNKDDFEKAFERLFKLYSEAKDSYWLAQLGELCLSLKLDVYVNKIVGFMFEEDAPDYRWRAKLLQARSCIMNNNLVEASDCIADAAHYAGEGKAEIFNLLGIVKRREGRISEAISCFENAVTLSHRDHRLYFNIALCYNSLHMTDDAIQGLRKALNIFPKYMRAKNLLVRISQQ
jgi:tetratricopeptide (TPR) repeat protein